MNATAANIAQIPLGMSLTTSEALVIARKRLTGLPPYPSLLSGGYREPSSDTVTEYRLLTGLSIGERGRASDICAVMSKVLSDRVMLPKIAWFGLEGGLLLKMRDVDALRGDIVGMMVAHHHAGIRIGLLSTRYTEEGIIKLIERHSILTDLVTYSDEGTPLIRGRQWVKRNVADAAEKTEDLVYNPYHGPWGILERLNGCIAITFPTTPFVEANEILIGYRLPSDSAFQQFVMGLSSDAHYVKRYQVTRRNTYPIDRYIGNGWHYAAFLDRALLYIQPFDDDGRIAQRVTDDEPQLAHMSMSAGLIGFLSRAVASLEGSVSDMDEGPIFEIAHLTPASEKPQ